MSGQRRQTADEIEVDKLRINLEYYVAFSTFLSLVFFGFAMRAVPPNASVTDEHAIDVVWACFMWVMGASVQIGGTWMMVASYRKQALAYGVKPDTTWIILSWTISGVVVFVFVVIYPILFHAIKP